MSFPVDTSVLVKDTAERLYFLPKSINLTNLDLGHANLEPSCLTNTTTTPTTTMPPESVSTSSVSFWDVLAGGDNTLPGCFLARGTSELSIYFILRWRRKRGRTKIFTESSERNDKHTKPETVTLSCAKQLGYNSSVPFRPKQTLSSYYYDI